MFYLYHFDAVVSTGLRKKIEKYCKNVELGDDHKLKVYYNVITKMKLKKSLFICLIAFLFAGCSDAPENKLSYTDVDTIKDIVLVRETNVTWTKEMEGGILTQTFPQAPVSSDVNYNVETVQVLPSYKNAVYPSLGEFGSLDTSAFSDNQKKLVFDFCTAISENIFTGGNIYFQSKYTFNYFFFKKELQDKWEEKFEEPFPINQDDLIIESETDTTQSNLNENKSEAVADTETEEKKVEPLFSKWIIGEPFLSEVLCEVPVRFYCHNGTIDVTIYINPKSENSIYQIIINRWEKFDEQQ